DRILSEVISRGPLPLFRSFSFVV
ncbi:uncharacterized protein METZ01_LOCUS446079, partial [marine metagenome]